MSNNKSYIGLLSALGAIALVGTLAGKKLIKATVNRVHDKLLGQIISEVYDDNLWELVSSTVRLGPDIVVESSLRAEEGKIIERPMGPPRKFPSLDKLKFDLAQLQTMPTEVDTRIVIRATIGPMAKRPLRIEHFMIIAPMAYGLALSERAKLALAKGAAAANTASHVGAGAYLEGERKAAKYLIYQYNRGDWGKTPEILCSCDAIEIQLGQGAYAGVGHIFDARLMDENLRKDFGKKKGESLITYSRQPEVSNPADLKGLIDRLRILTDGIPIGVKLAAGMELEADLAWVCSSGADFVVVDGAEAATRGSPPILQDDFGVPTVFAIDRAARWMKSNGYKDRVSLIASGGIKTPGDALKVRALGADACQIGAIALVAVSHPQILKAMPFEPPTVAVLYGKSAAKKFNVEEGAKALKNFFESCKLEMAEGIRALGKVSISQVDKNDLTTTDEMYARALDIPLIYEPYNGENVPVKVRKIKL